MSSKILKHLLRYHLMGFLILNILSKAGCPQVNSDEIERLYILIKGCLIQNRWEEAKYLLEYFKTFNLNSTQYKTYLKILESDVNECVNENLERLYDTGLDQLKNYQFSLAKETFTKISHYDPEFRDVKKLLKETSVLIQEWEKINNLGRTKRTKVVTSKIIDKNEVGLRIYNPDKCYNGYTLFVPQSVSNSFNYNYIYLINMQGKITYKYILENTQPFIAKITPQGHLIYFDPDGIYEIEPPDKEIWNYMEMIDHDFQILDNGNLLISTAMAGSGIDEPQLLPRLQIISRNKHILWEWRGEEHIQELEKLLGLNYLDKEEYLHIHTCDVFKDNPLGHKDKRFKKNNIVVSFDHIGVVAVIDYPSGRIVWAWGPGIISGKLSTSILSTGNLLIFDNGINRGWSRVIEVNPSSEEIVWEYHAEPKESFFSIYWGNAQGLPNGNVLICESEFDHIFEITPEGEIVWDFISPFGVTTGCHGIYRAYRYSADFVKKILKNRESRRKNE